MHVWHQSPNAAQTTCVCKDCRPSYILVFEPVQNCEEERVAMHMKHVLGAVGLAALLLLRLVKHESVNHVKAP